MCPGQGRWNPVGPEVQELLKKLVRANTLATVIRVLQEWRETTPGIQQRRWAVVVGSAALQVLTGVLLPGAKLHPQQHEELEVRVREGTGEASPLAGMPRCSSKRSCRLLYGYHVAVCHRSCRPTAPGSMPQVFVRSLVSELHGLRETLTLEQLSAVASSLVVLLPLLGTHSGEPAGSEVQDAVIS